MSAPMDLPMAADGGADDTRRLLAQLRGQPGAGRKAANDTLRRECDAPKGAEASAGAGRRVGRMTVVALAVLVAGALAWHPWQGHSTGMVSAESAQPAATAGAAAATQPADATNATAAPTAPTAATRSQPAAPAHASNAVLLEASGFVVARRQATVSASQTGRLARLFVTEGEQVHRGDLIAELDAGISQAEVAYAEAGVRAAERSVEVTRRKLEAAHRAAARDQGLAKDGFISAAGLDQSTSSVDTLQAQLEAELSQVAVAREQQRIQMEQMQGIQVRAPFDGVVTGIAAHEGEIVSPVSGGGGFTRTGICTIVDPSSVEGEVDVNERYLGRLQPGQPVLVHLPAYPKLSFKGTVATLPAVIDRNTAAARIRVSFPAPAAELRPGLRADFSFEGA
jgi:RND family efflux transporter MFP subunit